MLDHQDIKQETPNAKGLALISNKNSIDYVDNIQKHSDIIISCKIKLQEKASFQTIQIYAPTSDHDDETVEMFYKELEKATDKEACSHHRDGDRDRETDRDIERETETERRRRRDRERERERGDKDRDKERDETKTGPEKGERQRQGR